MLLMSCFVMLSCLFIAALWLPEGNGLMFVMFIVMLLLSRFVPGTGVVLDCIDSGLILAVFLTFI